jgi:hypothetical protein
MLLAQIDRAPERLKSILRQVSLRSMLRTVEAFLMAYPPEKWRHSSRPWMPCQRCGPTSKRGGFPLTPQRTLAHSPALHHEKEQTMAYDLRLDETYSTGKGQWRARARAGDKDGETMDVVRTAHRDPEAA